MRQGYLNVSVFGKLHIEYGGETIQLPLDIHSITVQFLLILWDRGKKGISRSLILDSLYGDNEVSDPANSMRVNLFRLRKMIKKLPLPDHEYILSDHGIYWWDDSDIGLRTDVGRFEDWICQSGQAEEAGDRNELLRKACDLYDGEFLPPLAAEQWAAVRAMGCKHMYTAAVSELYKSYMEDRQYDQAALIAGRAFKIYPYEEFAVMKIDAFIAQGYFQKALDVLDGLSKLLFKDLGIMPSEEMMKRYEAVSRHVEVSTTAMKNMKQQIEESVIDGAYYCPFPSFVDCYRILRRLSMRDAQPVLLVNCIMTDAQGRKLSYGKKVLENAPILMKAIEKSLRAGDVYTRSNDNLFFILLSGVTVENSYIVTNRISREFCKSGDIRGIKLDFNIMLSELKKC
ncbi:MAG: hypothetical protein LUE94_06920 [Clostridiales bacterium]|nr:hypothetical protein [Clostridiales bacterium]